MKHLKQFRPQAHLRGYAPADRTADEPVMHAIAQRLNALPRREVTLAPAGPPARDSHAEERQLVAAATTAPVASMSAAPLL